MKVGSLEEIKVLEPMKIGSLEEIPVHEPMQAEELEVESLAGRVIDPGVVLGTGHTSVQPELCSGDLPGGDGAGVGEGAGGLTAGQALALPVREVAQSRGPGRLLHPLDYLK